MPRANAATASGTRTPRRCHAASADAGTSWSGSISGIAVPRPSTDAAACRARSSSRSHSRHTLPGRVSRWLHIRHCIMRRLQGAYAGTSLASGEGSSTVPGVRCRRESKQFTRPSCHRLAHRLLRREPLAYEYTRSRARSRRLVMHNTTIAFAQVSRWRLLRLIWPFLAIVVLLLALGTASLQMIRGVRAYISFESVWSNAQKAAVEALDQYAQTRNEDHFDRYVEESAVLAGARLARLELEKPFPDFASARRALLQARNHPDDIGEMIDLFRRFRRVRFMDDGIRLWSEADRRVERIEQIAHEIRTTVHKGARNPADLSPLLVEMHTLDRELTLLERGFSD